MTEVVWDSSAILAVLNRETGWERLLEQGWASGCVSTVNFSEVAAKLTERGMPENEVREVLAAIELETVDFTAADAVTAGLLRRSTRDQGLSLGDRACLALALRLQTPVLTADRAWQALDLSVEIRLARTL